MARYKPVSNDQVLIVPVILNWNWEREKWGQAFVCSFFWPLLNISPWLLLGYYLLFVSEIRERESEKFTGTFWIIEF